MITCTYRDLAGLRDQANASGIIVRQGPLTKLTQADETRVPLLMDRIRIGRFVQKISDKIRQMEGDALAILRKYGTQSKTNPAAFDIPAKNRAKWNEENAKLDDTECEITLLPLPESVYGSLPLTAGDLSALMKFIELSPENRAMLTQLEKDESTDDGGLDGKPGTQHSGEGSGPKATITKIRRGG